MPQFEPPEGRTAIMGVLNVTPDSFSDGGQFLETGPAIERGLQMAEHGADIIDVGGESTRPGAAAVRASEELRRVLPVVEALSKEGVPVSIDTRKATVAEQALDAGAVLVNDVSALTDPGMAELCAARKCLVCLMHMQGQPRDMQRDPTYHDVVKEVERFLLERAGIAEYNGVAKDRIWIDPGIGFGKTTAHNLSLLRHIPRLARTGYPVMVGVSRKSFIGRLLGSAEHPLPVDERLEGTLVAQALAVAGGAKIIRSHDIVEARRSLRIVDAILRAR